MIIPDFCYSFFIILSVNSFAYSEKNSNRKFPLKGIIPPVYTPMDEHGHVDVSVIPVYAKYLKNKGMSGALVAGTAGEGPNMSVCEKKKLIEAWVKAAKPLGLTIVFQAGGVPFPDIIELARFAEEKKVDAILVLPTTYYKPESPKELTTMLKIVSEAAPSLPLLYYNVPKLSGVNVDMTEFFKMASKKIPQFKGLKTDLEVVLNILAATELKPDQGFGISGDVLLLESVAMGQNTFFFTLGNFCPELVKEVINCTTHGDMKGARRAQEKLNKLSVKISAFGDVSGQKAATELVSGITLGNPRPPLPTLSPQELLIIKAALEESGIKVNNDLW